MAGVFVPNKKKQKGVSPCFFVGAHTKAIYSRERKRYRKREVVKKTEEERRRKGETERERGGRNILFGPK